MSRAIDHHCLRLLLIRGPDSDDIKSAITKKKSRATGEAFCRRCVQHLDFDSGIRRCFRVFRGFNSRRRLLSAESLVSSPSVVTRTADNCGKKNPPPDFHRKLFQSATVSGKM
jgi:hypothetical protein